MALADLVKYVIKGTGVGSEIWQTQIWLQANAQIGSVADLQTAVDDEAAGVTTLWTAIKPYIYTSYALTELHGYYYTNGHADADYAAVHVFTPAAGTLATAAAPVDTCLVCSTRTGRAGQSYRGRMYFPCHAVTQPSTGLFSSSITAIYVNACAAFLSDINSGYGSVVVTSRTADAATFVTSVSADNKPDVQRRRENRLSGGTPATASVTPH